MPRSKKGPEDASPEKKTAAKKTTASRAKKSTTNPVEMPIVAENSVPVVVVAQKEPIDIEHQIRVRAYQLYLERNGGNGDPQQDWFRAEAEVRAKLIA